MLPAADVVAGPDGGVALDTGVAGTGQHEGTLRGTLPPRPVEAGARPLHAVGVVKAPVRQGGTLRALGPVPGVQRQRRAGGRIAVRRQAIRQRRLVHVVPDAGDASLQQHALTLAPPGSDLRAAKVWEGAVARPDDAGEERAIGAPHEVVARQPLAERRVGGIHLHPRIEDRDDFEALLREIADEPARRGKAAGREGEDAIAVHIVYVEPERVAGDLA